VTAVIEFFEVSPRVAWRGGDDRIVQGSRAGRSKSTGGGQTDLSWGEEVRRLEEEKRGEFEKGRGDRDVYTERR